MSSSGRDACPLCSATREPLYRWNGFDLYRCTECRTESVDPLPDARELGRFYQSMSGKKMVGSERRLALVREAFRAYLALYATACDGRRPTRFCDVGGGVGYYVRAALEHDIDACLLDWAEDALRFARRDLGIGRAVRGDIQRCGDLFAAESFDFVLARHVIEHVRDPRLFLRQLGGVLRPGGILQIETPNVASREQLRHPGVIKEIYRLIRRANPSMSAFSALQRALGKSVSGVNPPKHLWGFTPGSLTALLRANGFEPVVVARAVAGHPTYDPLFFELQRAGPRTPWAVPHYVWQRATTPLFADTGMNLAVTARRASA